MNWLPVFGNEYHKQIIREALQKRVNLAQVTVYGFVTIPNHLYCIWQLHDEINRANFQRDVLKFTSRSLLNFIRKHDYPLLTARAVKAADRKFQVWDRNSLSTDLFTEKVFLQKVECIHNNPVQPKWKLATLPEEYYWSSAAFYETGVYDFSFLTHHRS